MRRASMNPRLAPSVNQSLNSNALSITSFVLCQSTWDVNQSKFQTVDVPVATIKEIKVATVDRVLVDTTHSLTAV